MPNNGLRVPPTGWSTTDHGHAAWLVCWPGWATDGRIFPAWPELPANRIVPVFSHSSATTLTAWLDANNIAACHLLGWSLGARRALHWAAAFPERVRSLTLVGLRPRFPTAELDQQRAALANDPSAALRHFYRRAFLGHAEAWQPFEAELMPRYLACVHHPMQVEGLIADLAELGEPLPESWPIAAERITIAHGGRDRIAPLAELQTWLAERPVCKLRVHPQAGHLPFVTDEFASLLTEVVRS